MYNKDKLKILNDLEKSLKYTLDRTEWQLRAVQELITLEREEVE